MTKTDNQELIVEHDYCQHSHLNDLLMSNFFEITASER